ncbi:MAG: M6 family metalloprotease domain-containing protein [Candidatus Eisenbacteria bacterium]
MKRQLAVRLLVLLAVLLAGRSACAVALRPDVFERLHSEGRVEHVRQMLELKRAEEPVDRNVKTAGSLRALVLMIDFDDVAADTILHSRQHFNEMLFSLDNELSMRNYYLWSSYGALDITGEIYGWFRVKEPLSYYANSNAGMDAYPRNAQKMIEDALDAADYRVDFSQFDNDGPDGIPDSGDDDGYVDFLMVVHAGQGYEQTMNPGHIHSHVSTIRARPVDGVYARMYSTEPEDGPVGTFAHEFGHLLGLPDLYDITLNTYGLGMWSLMAYGSWGEGGRRPVGLDPWCKTQLGFLEPVVIDSNYVEYELPCIEDGPDALKLWSQGETGKQYFMVENRRSKSWDSWLTWFDEGLLVYHVDERHQDNSSDSGHLISLEQADGRFDLEERRLWGFGSDGGDPYPGETGNRTFSWWTRPDNQSNEGSPTQVSLRNISDPGDVMTFDVEVWSPVILFEDYRIDDESGDGDGEPDPGEEINLGLRFRNRGITCDDLTVTLRTDDPHVTPGETVVLLEAIEGGSLSGVSNISMQIDETVPEPYDVEFEITIEGTHAYGIYQSTDRFVLGVPVRRLPGWPVFAGDGMTASPAVADLDGDGVKEIIVGCNDGMLYAWKLDGTPVPGWPAVVGAPVHSKPAVCDVDLDFRSEVVVTSRDGRVHVFENDGTPCPGWPRSTGDQILSSALLADIDDDGIVEIICGSTDGQVYAWNENGGLVSGWPVDMGGSEVWMSAAAADVDGDHLEEVVIGGYGGPLYVLDGNGEVLSGWPAPVGRGCGDGSPCVADFDGDGTLEIAISGLFSNSIYLVGLDGRIRPGWPRWPFNCHELSNPVPADIDNDGLPEVAVSTSCGTIVAWNANGSQCNAIEAHAPDPIRGCEPIFLDIDGNGSIEGLAGTSEYGDGEVYVFGSEGVLTGFPIDVGGEVAATPVVDDLDGDGNAEIVAVTKAGQVYVWRFVGPKQTGRIEYSQSRSNVWNTGHYDFVPHDNIPLADLALSAGDISLDPHEPREGEETLVKVRVANAGHTVAENFMVSTYDGVVEETHLIGSAVVAGLGAKSDTLITFAWEMPGGQTTRLVYATIDLENAVLERFELNNQAHRRFYLSLADLKVTIGDVRPFPVVIGESLTVDAHLENVGSDVARDFELVFYDSLRVESRRFAGFQVDSLCPGESMDFSVRHRIDSFRGDFVRLWGVVDPAQGVLEYHTSNNNSCVDVNSGIGGRLLTTPYEIAVTALKSSRTCFVLESPSCQCLVAFGSSLPYNAVFETLGAGVDVSRNTIVFSSGGDIAGFDVKDSVLFVISSAEEYETQPAVWGENVAWISEGPASTSLRLRRASGDIETIRSITTGSIRNPDLSNALIVWEEDLGGGSDIVGYDLEADTIVVLCGDDGDQVNPAVWGDKLVWEDHSADGGDVRALDFRSLSRLDVAAGDGLQRHPVVYGDIVVWQDSRNGNWDIYGYSFSNGSEFPISRQVDDQVLPSLSDSTVLWVDRREPGEIVLGLRFGADRRVASVREFEAFSQDGMIKVRSNVEQEDDGLVFNIYRYPDDRPMSEDRYSHLRYQFELGTDSVHVYADTLVAARRSFYYTLGIIDGYGVETYYGPVEGRAYDASPPGFVIGAPHPNPFRHDVTVTFGLPRALRRSADSSWPDPAGETSSVEMAVYSADGRLVRTIQRGHLTPGYYRLSWDGMNENGRPVSSGVYFITASAGDVVTSRKVILAK